MPHVKYSYRRRFRLPCVLIRGQILVPGEVTPFAVLVLFDINAVPDWPVKIIGHLPLPFSASGHIADRFRSPVSIDELKTKKFIYIRCKNY
jgi:hypothetical protein